MIRLAEVDRGRDNNFNLIRFLAATGVLVSHAWPLSLGRGTDEPLERIVGHSLGGLGVFVFFAVSGYFIAASFARSQTVKDFVLARVLRLFPGLAISILLVTLGVGTAVTVLPVAEYLKTPATWTAILRNVTLVSPQYTLPGVFESNPYPTVQGSIWTLIYEVLCYGLVFLAGISGLLLRRRAMTVAIGLYLVLWVMAGTDWLPVPTRLMQTRTLSLPFVIGMAFWVWRDRLVLSLPVALVLAILAGLAKGTMASLPALVMAVAYGTFWCAYVPKGAIRAFNRLGDYSYGIYVYAFPLQGLVVWLAGPMGPWTNIALAFPLTLTCAVLSWHLVERPVLSLRRRPTRTVPRGQPG